MESINIKRESFYNYKEQWRPSNKTERVDDGFCVVECMDIWHEPEEAVRPLKKIGVTYKPVSISKKTVTKISTESLETLFYELSTAWKNQTKAFSQAGSKINNKNYLFIIGLGVTYPDIITKLILQDLKKGPSYWHYALKKITNQNPVPSGNGTDIENTSQFWLNWGMQNHKL